jgi:hypothetical protein
VKLFLVTLAGLLLAGAARLPLEHEVFVERTRGGLITTTPVALGVREQTGQFGLVAALGGFRSVVADLLFIQAHVAWEHAQWSRVELLFREATTLQPHNILFWDTAAWHMAWNASAAALLDPAQPRLALRIRAQREYVDIGKDFLERGIRNNPEHPQLYEALARLYRDKYHDHARAAEFFDTRGNCQRMEMLKIFVVTDRMADCSAGQHVERSGLDVNDWRRGNADFRPNKWALHHVF